MRLLLLHIHHFNTHLSLWHTIGKEAENTLRFGRDSFSLLFNRIGVWVVRKCSNRGRNAVWKGYSTILWEGCFIVDAAIGEWCTVCCY